MDGIKDYRCYQTYWHERNFGCRIREFVYRGHRCLSLENQFLRIVIAAGKGTDILEFLYKPLDMELLWHSYNGLREFDSYRASSPLSVGHFRDYYAGGWHEILPNGAAPSEHRGASFGQHGEATHLPWSYQIEMDEPERVQVRFWVRLVRLPLVVQKTFTLESGSSTLQIHERLHNDAGQPVEALWGHHPTFGWPFLERGCRVYLPPCAAVVSDSPLENSRLAPSQRCQWPRVADRGGHPLDLSMIPGPEAGSQDFVRLEDLADGWFAIVNPGRQVGFAFRWDVRLFPVLGFWQVFRGAPDYPWYGMNYLAALEPACDLPSLKEAAARGTAIRIEPGRSVETELEATVFRSPLEVKTVKSKGILE
ncbi:MAG TPA: DUF4432 family protein [Candidatus Dormibacteraeota bacterium]|nr:DUF4432 family protein [Candidatus Dormibacteraeota bacterium]